MYFLILELLGVKLRHSLVVYSEVLEELKKQY